jgi:hypothetical protein
MNPEDTLYYKAWSGFFNDASGGTIPNGGWEGVFTPSNGLTWDTRTFISGNNDTVLAVQYYNPDGGSPAVEQYAAPFESKEDSLAIYFRVSMAAMMEAGQFNPDIHSPVGVRGAPETSGGTIDWGETRVLLTRETDSQHGGSFYSGVAYFDKDSVEAGIAQQYKFVFGTGPTWQLDPNRSFAYPMGLADTTLQWDWFNYTAPTGGETHEAVITWRVSTEALEAIGLFDRGVGDRIEIRGPRGWDGVDAVPLSYVPELQEWVSTNESFVNQEGAEIVYKYYIGWDSSRIDEESPNFIPNLNIEQGWEEPASTGGGNRVHVFQSTDQTVVGDWGFDRQFFNGVPANAVIDHNIAVTFNVDMTDATSGTTNTNTDLFRMGVDTVWVQWDGELTAWGQGTDMWTDATQISRFLQLTDPDEDGVYSGTYNLEVSETFPAIWFQLGYRVSYSTATPGTYVVNGSGGAVLGRRYYQYIHPTSINEGTPWPVPVWPTEFNLPEVPWTQTDLLVETPPNLTTATGIVDVDNLPGKYELQQNYPNPFNPSTSIKYQLAKASDVKIVIYNDIGQEVVTLLNENRPAGISEVIWNGRNTQNKNVASGIYFIKMDAGAFSQVRKMTLIR